MLKIILSPSGRRFYHASRFKKPDALVKVANKRVGKELKKRADFQANPKTSNYNPALKFEPFPFAITEENKLEILKKIVTPLGALTYDEQLDTKQTQFRNALRHFARQLYNTNTPIRLDVRKLPCHVNDIVKAPKIYKYRNRDAYGVWTGHDGTTNIVGYFAFPLGKHGNTVCLEPNGSLVTPDEVIKLVDILQEFIRTQAKLPVSYDLRSEGGWRSFNIRNNSLKELMLTGIANPRALKVQDIVDERDNFRDFITARARELEVNLKSLYFQPCHHMSCSNKTVPYELLYGDKNIIETVNGFKFALSPETYFLENTGGAEVLYKTLLSSMKEYFYINSDSKPLVIDIRCGSGIGAIHLSSSASHVIGIDASDHAIEDSKCNALLNQIENCKFINAQVEMVLEQVLENYTKRLGHEQKCIAVCSIPKAGLHPNVIQVLLESRHVDKVIFITSYIENAGPISNLVELCRKRSGKSLPPFAPIAATPIDTYPHCELYDSIIFFERLPVH